ncbi:MAG: RNA methyltransferase [Wenzhouxiangella sp.]|jgi:TrmH family RNA methyltransferase|nr:RNA methyltransferase [Wenzhouxiangella sp.]
MENLAQRVRIVLVGTSHPGNIGSAARAMKVMGFSRLYLVAPTAPFPSSRATALATSGDDVLESAVVVDDLLSAIEGCGLVLGTSALQRSLPLPVLDPRSAAARTAAEAPQHDVALVFGREKSGLNNLETDLCHFLVNIPTSEVYHSLNLAQAVQVLTYELHLAMQEPSADSAGSPERQPEPAERMEIYFERLETTLRAIGFLNPEQPKRLMQRLRRLYLRARPDENELNILNGILSSTLRAARGRDEREGA